MQEVVIVSAARTPFGLYQGSLADQRCQDLAACSMKEAVTRAGIDSARLDASIFSEAMQTSLPANVGRHGWLLADLDENPAGFTMNALCAGALQTMISGFNKILAGEYQGILAGGVETNSQAPYYILHPRYQFGQGNLNFHDQKLEVQTNAQPVELYGELTTADIADTMARNYGLSRSELDEYTLASLARAKAALKDGAMKEAIAGIVKKVKKGEVMVDADEAVKRSVSMDKLMALPFINPGGLASSGNIAPLADGSASIILLSADRAKELGCKPMAKMLGFGVAAGNPALLDRTAIRSMEKALNNAGKSMADLDFIDIHEPSAAFSLAVSRQIGDSAKINVAGGSLAFGHAGAATGGAMMTNMLYRLDAGCLGMVNVGALGGQAISILVEKI